MLESLWCRIRRQDIMPFSMLGLLDMVLRRRPHLVEATALRMLLEKNLSFTRVEQAALPLHIVATDVLSGNEIVISSGPVVDAGLASAAIPRVFPPLRIDGANQAQRRLFEERIRVDDINFECTGCGNCCHDLRLALTVTEAIDWLQRGGQMELLCEAIPWPVEPEPGNAQAEYKRARSTPAMSGTLPVRISITLAAAFTGACPNLHADMRCGIYEHRPLVCRIYPAEINPFVALVPENKGCPVEAWQKTPLQRQGVLVDETTYQLVQQSRQANQLEAPLRTQICLELGLNSAALANEGFVIHAPESDALLAALQRIQAAPASQDATAEWVFVSNRTETVETLLSVGAAGHLVAPTPADTFRYHGFFPSSPA